MYLTYTNWCITGLEGLVTMLKNLEDANAPITEEMAARYIKAADKIGALALRATERIENKS